MDQIEIKTLEEQPELKQDLLKINKTAWPEFLLHWKCPKWKHLFTTFADYQLLFLNKGQLAAFGHTIPVRGDVSNKTQSDAMRIIIEQAVQNKIKGMKPNILIALAAVVADNHRDKGLSFEIVKAMKKLAAKRHLSLLLVPVRPTLKYKYPLIPLAEYVEWKRDDGLPFDPWLRVHKKLGGKKFKISLEFMKITGTGQEWEEWTGLKISGKGEFIVPGALNPVKIECENDFGIYYDPCVWVKYEIGSI